MLLVDTGAFYALADSSDRHHRAAAAFFEVRAPPGDLITTDHIFVETWCLIRARLGRPAALRYWDAMETGLLTVLGVSAEDLRRARTIARDWPDQNFSVVDCTSFALMERLGIEEAFAFDSHFKTYRAGTRNERPFQVRP
jgi:predicted nucleic acid-binding protein